MTVCPFCFSELEDKKSCPCGAEWDDDGRLVSDPAQ